MAAERTPLYGCHVDHGGRMVEFAGWSLPVQFTDGVIAEHQAVRTAAGLFDVSHMSRFELTGPGAEDFIDGLITNNVRKLPVGSLLYTALCQEDGGTIDDLVVYRFADHFLIVANASNHDPVWEWLEQNRNGGVRLHDRTREIAHLALQGPRSQPILQRVVDTDLEPIGYYQHAAASFDGEPMLLSRNGYTGEDGFELYVPSAKGPALWRALMEAGGSEIRPVGLGARDTLRLEVAYPLYGHELSREITPIEAGIGWVVKTKGRRFVGHERLREQKTNGSARKVVGLEYEGRLTGRQGADVLAGGRVIGQVTSGTFGPSVEKGISLALVASEHADLGTALDVDVRGRRVEARVVALPFYTEGSHR